MQIAFLQQFLAQLRHKTRARPGEFVYNTGKIRAHWRRRVNLQPVLARP
jgi:hypothetical protein